MTEPTCKLITPATLSLEASNIAVGSDGHSEWNSGTTYYAEDMVMVTTSEPHKIYECLQTNANKPPADNPTYWQDQGGTNRWKMFDGYLNTQSSRSDNIEVDVAADNCDQLYLFGLDATSIDISLYDNDESEVVQTGTTNLAADQISVIIPIYIYADSTLTVTINKSGSTAKCGVCGVGLSTVIGITQWGLRPQIVDYSIKDTNESGYTYLSQGNWAQETDVEVLMDSLAVDNVYENLVDVRGTVCVLDANQCGTDYDSARQYGYMRDWEILLEKTKEARVKIDFMGVI